MVALANSAKQYVGSDKYNAVTGWAASTVTVAGTLIRQTSTPTLGNERVFVAIVAGTTGGSEPAWVVTKGAKNTDNTVTWQECTGQPGVNGDITNSPVWGATLTVVLGQIIYDSVTTSLQICSTAGTTKSGSPPSFSAVAGVTTTDNTVTWTSLGLASGFAAFAAPHSRVLNADAATWQTVTPAIIYISNGHAETQTVNMTLAGGQGTAPKPNQYLCVSNSIVPPTAVTTGASIGTSANNTNITITGFSYYAGITFKMGISTNSVALTIPSSTESDLVFENCAFNIVGSASTSSITFGTTSGSGNSCLINLSNCTFTYSSTAQKTNFQVGTVNISGGSFCATGSIPTPLLTIAGFTNLVVRDCDLSSATGNLVNYNNAISGGFLNFENCRVNAGATFTTGTIRNGSTPTSRFHNCDSGATNYKFTEVNYLATLSQSVSTYNNAGASNGVQNFSWQLVSTANATFGQPYNSPEIVIWNDLTGSSKTATVQIAGANTLTNADIWMEIEYLGSSSSPIGSIANCRVADAIATPSNVTSSSATWTGSPAHTQQLQVTFTPQMAGPVIARIYVARPSVTVFVDPLITIS